MSPGDLVRGAGGVFGIIIKAHVIRLDLQIRYDVLFESHMYYNITNMSLKIVK